MKCPNCGFEIPENEHKCLKCGNVIKAVTVTHYDGSDNNNSDNYDGEQSETIDIDPSKIRMGKDSSSPFDSIFGGGIFGGFNSILDGLFGNIFDVFGDGGEDDGDDGDYVAYDDFGNPFPIDVYDRDFIEVKDVEILDEDGNVIEKNGKKQKPDKQKQDGKKKKKD